MPRPMSKKDVFAYQACWRKRKYGSREEAQEFRADGTPVWRVYKCKNCRGFHRATRKKPKA